MLLRQTIEQGGDRNTEASSDLDELRGANAIETAFVFLHLLEGQADGIRQLRLAHSEFLAQFANTQADMAVDRVDF